jgi:hypothetical protein
VYGDPELSPTRAREGYVSEFPFTSYMGDYFGRITAALIRLVVEA